MEKQSKNQYFSRNLFDILKKWVDRKEIYVIKGPRQSGKTTLLKMLSDWLIAEYNVNPEHIVFLTFEDRDILEKFSQDPKRYVESLVAGKKQGRLYILIDEFHYLENGGKILKLLYDLFENIKFVITGSSSLELTGHTAKFLVGRAFSFYLWQFTFGEFLNVKSKELSSSYNEISRGVRNFIEEGKSFSSPQKDIFGKDFERLFSEYSLWGGYPEAIKTDDAETKYIILKNIYDTYVSRDIIELLTITDISRFRKLLESLSLQIGSLISYNNLASDIKGYYKEIKHYLSVLEETFVISLLRPYYSSKITELKKNPKVYFIDTGLRNYLINNLGELSSRTDGGAIVENVVFNQLRRTFGENFQIKYWRTQAKAEVDFLLEQQDRILPVEVKYSVLKSPKISRSLRNFITKYHPQRAIIATRGFSGEDTIGSTLVRFVPVWYI